MDYIFTLLRITTKRRGNTRLRKSIGDVWNNAVWTTSKSHTQTSCPSDSYFTTSLKNNCIADTAEDFAKKVHQTGIRLDNLTAKLKNTY